ncbi:MAG: hypothetical protein AAFQ82_24035, partial [Myxococcota bacterium]
FASASTRGAADCAHCHQTESFAATLFDHNDPAYSDYPLEGRHRGVACEECHGTVELKTENGPLGVVRYRPVPKTCTGCHSDYHNGALRGLE